MAEHICESCQRYVSESEPHHKYEEDATVLCDDCYKYYKHDIGRTG